VLSGKGLSGSFRVSRTSNITVPRLLDDFNETPLFTVFIKITSIATHPSVATLYKMLQMKGASMLTPRRDSKY
jgi:hypothetical protein